VRPEPPLHIALLHPEIGPNTGNIGRLCLGVNAQLHLVHPLGFRTDDKAVRRAGLDYWKSVSVQEHPSAEAFWVWAEGRRMRLYSTHGTRSHIQAEFQAGDVLLFGSESKGLPSELIERLGALKIPMTGPIRSLNLANAVAVATYTALQQITPEIFSLESGQ
jgi:tRNA (cytidine/uridine-2'-O-)-methyltransferase